MALSPTQMDDKLDEHFAFEARDDLDGVLGTLSPEAEHDVVGWPTGVARGREGAGAFYETLFADLSDGSTETIRRLYGEDFVVDESLWRGRASGRPFGLDGRGRPLEFRLLHIFQFDGAGAIARENVWIDLAALINQLPQD